MKHEIWNKLGTLGTTDKLVLQDLIESLEDYKKETIKQYLNVLYKAKYITATM